MANIKIAFYSDLHTECEFTNPSELVIDNNKDYYIFAGDLFNHHNAERFLKQLRKKTEKEIIVVLGNHDFYNGHYENLLKKYRILCQKYNIVLLEQDVYIHHEHKLLVFGATFWSDFKRNNRIDEIAMLEAKRYIADFRYIRTKNFRSFTPEDEQKISEETQEKLQQSFNENILTLEKYQHYTKIVVSHFPPLTTLGNPVYKDSMLSAYFQPDYAQLLNFADIWIYGHNHYNVRTWHISDKGQKTLLLSNQHGYISRFNVRECKENFTPMELNFKRVEQVELDAIGTDFYCNICVNI